MTREDAKDYIREWCPYDRQEEIIKALEQEPCIKEKQANADKIDAVYIDGFKAEYSQARFDLEQEPILDKIRAEIDEQYDRVHPYNISCAEGLEMALGIIDKYRAEGSDKE